MQHPQEAAASFESPKPSSAHFKPFHLFMDSSSESSDWDESQWTVPTDDDKDPQKGSIDLHTDDCPFCSCLISAKHRFLRKAEVRGLVFHEQCQSCSSPYGARIRLCDFCKHLRLGHLVNCIWTDSRFHDLWIELDPEARAQSRTKCDLCGFLTDATSLPQTGPSEDKFIVAASAKLVCESSGSSIVGHRGNPPTRDICLSLEVDRQVATNIPVHVEKFVQWNVIRDWLLKDYSDEDEKIRHWLLTGESDEDDSPSRKIRPKPTLPLGFRVIDVNERCVAEKKGFCEYMALSYVWGTRSESARYVEQATCDNIESLKVPGGLTQLPETIEDAMVICQKLGIDYLWVDRYCIVQDDAVHKHTQVSAMAKIYSSARLTLIACSGKDGVESGIPGVRRKREWKWHRINIQGLTLSYSLPSLEDILPRSIWNTRGWTYQEAILSKRKLIMTPMEAWFQYGERLFREHPPHYQNPNASALRDWKRPKESFKHYASNVRRYTRRKLGYASDIYNAFDGIAHALSEGNYSFHFGLPESEFDQALLWYCGCRWNDARSGCLRSCEETTPSWSWGSVTCGVLYAKSFYVTLVKWVLYETQVVDMSSQSTNPETYGAHGKELKAMNEPKAWRDWRLDWRERKKRPCPQLAFALAVNEGCIEADKNFTIPKRESFPSLEARFTRRWPSYADAYEEVRQVHTHHSSGPHGVLFTKAHSAFFHIKSKLIKTVNGRAIGSLRQVDIGDKCSDDSANEMEDEYEECSTHKECSAGKKYHVEGIALSISKSPEQIPEFLEKHASELRLSGKKAYRQMQFFDYNGDSLNKIPVVNVMFTRREDRYARRIGLGWIFLKQWGSIAWTLKDIWLK